MAQSSPLTFEIYRGEQLLSSVTRTEESVTLGSGEDALLTLAGEGVGALHAVINVADDGQVHLLDLGTEGGTQVNGQPVSSNTSLNSGDALQLGDLRVVVQFGAPDPFEDDVATIVTGGEAPDLDDDVIGLDEPTSPGIDDDATDGGVARRAESAPTAPPGFAQVPASPKATAFNTREDVLSFILRSNASGAVHPTEKNRPRVLEVSHIWSNTLLDTQHFPLDGKAVTIGANIAYHWNILGVDFGHIPSALRFLAQYAPPFFADISSDWKSDFYAPEDALPDGSEHKLLVWEEDHYVARVGKSWGGYVLVNGERKTFADLIAAGDAKESAAVYLIPMDDTKGLMVDIDGVSFFAHTVNGARRTVRGSEVDYLFVAMLCILGTLGGVFGGVMWFAPPAASTSVQEIPDRFADLLLQTPPEETKDKKPDNNPDAGEGEKAKKEEGKTGKKDAKVEQAKGNKVEVAQQEVDRQVAESAGILAALSSDPGMAGFGAAGLSSDLTGGIGGLLGAKGTQIGSGGLGSRGSGLGGGGNAEGLGGLGTHGTGSGASGYGSGGGNLGERGEGGIGTFGGDPIILGALDRSLIDEVIKRHMNQIRYCYQRELSRDGSLAGKVVIRFTIAGDGTVSQASVKETTMGNSAVETCITGRFMRMQFPEPRGGGVVIVSYPFLFSPG